MAKGERKLLAEALALALLSLEGRAVDDPWDADPSVVALFEPLAQRYPTAALSVADWELDAGVRRRAGEILVTVRPRPLGPSGMEVQMRFGQAGSTVTQNLFGRSGDGRLKSVMNDRYRRFQQAPSSDAVRITPAIHNEVRRSSSGLRVWTSAGPLDTVVAVQAMDVFVAMAGVQATREPENQPDHLAEASGPEKPHQAAFTEGGLLEADLAWTAEAPTVCHVVGPGGVYLGTAVHDVEEGRTVQVGGAPAGVVLAGGPLDGLRTLLYEHGRHGAVYPLASEELDALAGIGAPTPAQSAGRVASAQALPPNEGEVLRRRVRAARKHTTKPGFGPYRERVARAVRAVEDRGLQLPEDIVHRACAALYAGHLILAGPPGTGKTTLAGVLAEAFEAEARTVTASELWTSDDLIGGMRFVEIHGQRAFVPRLGPLAEVALAGLEAQRPHWLVIDEFSRASIDACLGPAYSALSPGSELPVELAFLGTGDDAAGSGSAIPLPPSMRIIGTLNEIDAQFVERMSAGLQRRFTIVPVEPPPNEQWNLEVARAWVQVDVWLDLCSLDRCPEEVQNEVEGIVLDLLDKARGSGWPVGTAQVVELFKHVALAAATVDDVRDVMDRAICDTLYPQLRALDHRRRPAATSAFRGFLDAHGLDRTKQRLGNEPA